MADVLTKEATFTPGPWWACFDKDQPVPYYRGLVMYVSSDPHISVCTGNAGDKSGAVTCERDEWEGNARLIAAAPDLYETLRSIRAKVAREIQASGGIFSDTELRAIDAALAKARGEDR